MIPTLLVIGLLFGRWWRTVPIATLGWVAWLLADGVLRWNAVELAGAAVVAAVNTGVGVLVHHAVRLVLTRAWRRDTP